MRSGLDGEVDSYSTTYSYRCLTKRVHLSEPQFPHLYNGNNYSTYRGLW